MAFDGRLGDRAKHCESYVLICCTMTGCCVPRRATLAPIHNGHGISSGGVGRTPLSPSIQIPSIGGCDLLRQASFADDLTGAQRLFPLLAKSNAFPDGGDGAARCGLRHDRCILDEKLSCSPFC
jgi:hypothetical protein